MREAVFLATWTVQHVIDTNPGGVAGPIRVATFSADGNGQFQAIELPDSEIAEHQQAIESAATALRKWRDEIQSGPRMMHRSRQLHLSLRKRPSLRGLGDRRKIKLDFCPKV